MAAVASGGGGDAAAALRAIGVSVTDATGKLRSSDVVFTDIAQKFSILKDGAEKSALAVAIFGKSGAELIPLLNEGRKGLADASAEAQRFGVVVGGDAAAAAEQFNDNVTRIQEAARGLFNQIAQGLLPIIVDLSNQFVDFVANGNFARDFVDAMKKEIRDFQAFLIGAQAALISVAAIGRAIAEDFKAIASGNFDQVGAGYAKAGDNIAEAWRQARNQIAQLKQEAGDGKANLPVKQGAKQTVNSFGFTGELAGDGIKKAAAAARKARPAFDNLKAAAERIFENTRTPLEQYKEGIADLNLLLRKGYIDQETYGRGVKQLQDAFDGAKGSARNLGQEVGQTLGDEFKSWLDSALEGTFKLKDALIGLTSKLADFALDFAFSGLSGKSGGGGFLSSLFKGLLGFAKGGTIYPSGSGGIDSQLVAFRKSPNERVDITKPGQRLTSGGGQKQTVINQYIQAAGEEAMARVALRATEKGLRVSQRGEALRASEYQQRFG
jgi:hypothetical protein